MPTARNAFEFYAIASLTPTSYVTPTRESSCHHRSTGRQTCWGEHAATCADCPSITKHLSNRPSSVHFKPESRNNGHARVMLHFEFHFQVVTWLILVTLIQDEHHTFWRLKILAPKVNGVALPTLKPLQWRPTTKKHLLGVRCNTFLIETFNGSNPTQPAQQKELSYLPDQQYHRIHTIAGMKRVAVF